MRKVFINKWFILASALTLTLSIFSFIAYKKVEPICSVTQPGRLADPDKNTDLLWDVLSRQFSSFISIQ
jgi:hypothetical protein